MERATRCDTGFIFGQKVKIMRNGRFAAAGTVTQSDLKETEVNVTLFDAQFEDLARPDLGFRVTVPTEDVLCQASSLCAATCPKATARSRPTERVAGIVATIVEAVERGSQS